MGVYLGVMRKACPKAVVMGVDKRVGFRRDLGLLGLARGLDVGGMRKKEALRMSLLFSHLGHWKGSRIFQ